MKKINTILLILLFTISLVNRDCFAVSSGGILCKLDSSIQLETLLSPTVNQAFSEIKAPGAIIGVWMGDAKPFVTGVGVADLNTREPMKIDDRMRIGSITKTFTGTVILQLADEGKISLSDKLSKYFPDYPNGDNITIEQLGNMTSGLFNYTEDEIWQKGMTSNFKRAYTPMELIEESKRHEPNFPPGTSFHYSNTNFIILGLIIEKITGNPLQNEIQNRILNPLGMQETFFALDETFPSSHPRSYFYADTNAVVPIDVTDLNPSWGWAAGSMISTVGDLHKFAKPLATGQLLSAKSQMDRLKWGSPMFPNADAWKDKEVKYGFGICSFDGAQGHNGGIPGFNSFMAYLPEKDATIIVLANMNTTKEGFSPADFIGMKILEKLKSI